MAQAETTLGGEAAALLEEYLGKIAACVSLLGDDRLWHRPAPRCNSIGNLLLHLDGNLSQWILAALGGELFERRRRTEFTVDRVATGAELVGRLRGTVTRCVHVARALGEKELAVEHSIQGYRKSGFGAVFHAVEHMSYHTGQIVLLTKLLVDREVEIEFYPHLAGT